MKNNLLSQASGISNPVFKGTALEGFMSSTNSTSFFDFLLKKSVLLVLIVGAIVFFFMLVTGAIQWISSAGDKQTLETARGKITNALTGLVILFAAFALITFIETFFDVSILTLDITPLVIP